MMKVIQSLRPLDRALTGILGQLWFPKRDTFSPFSLWSISPAFPPFESMNIFLIPFGLFCHPSVASAVADTPNLCLNLNCMTNLLLKASDPDGQRKYLSSKTRTSPPVSVAPKKRTLSPWCVPPQPRDYVFLIALSKVPGVACPLCQFPPLHRHHCQRLPPFPVLIQRQVFVGTTSHLLVQHRDHYSSQYGNILSCPPVHHCVCAFLQLSQERYLETRNKSIRDIVILKLKYTYLYLKMFFFLCIG